MDDPVPVRFLTFSYNYFVVLCIHFVYTHVSTLQEYFKSPNFLEQLEWLTKTLTPPQHQSGVNISSDQTPSPPPSGTPLSSFPYPLLLHHPHPRLGSPLGFPPPSLPPSFLTPTGCHSHPGGGSIHFGPRIRPLFPFMKFDLCPPIHPPPPLGGSRMVGIGSPSIMSINSQPIIRTSNDRKSSTGNSSSNFNNTAGGQCYMSPPWR